MAILEDGQTPLVIAYDPDLAAYVLFAYGEKPAPTKSDVSSDSSTTTGEPELPPTPPAPYLIEKQLDNVPDDLKQYVAPFPIRPTSHLGNFQSSYRSSPNNSPSAESTPILRGIEKVSASAASESHGATAAGTTSTSPALLSPTSAEFLKQPYPQHLRYITIINSTSAGTKQSTEIFFSIIVPLLKRFGIAHVYVATSSAQTIPNHAKSFTNSSTVLLLAGDTSISEFVNSLVDQPQERKTRKPNSSPKDDPLHLNVICIPTGSGNAISHSIGHDSIAKAISRIFLGELQPLANFKVEFPLGSSPVTANTELPKTLPQCPTQIPPYHVFAVISWALHASLVADSDSAEFRKFGVTRFQMAAADNLKRPQNYKGAIALENSNEIQSLRVNGEPGDKNQPISLIDGSHSYVLFTLISQLEKGYVISPHCVAPTSKALYLIDLPYLPSDQLHYVINLPYKAGKHIEDSRVRYVRITARSDLQTTDQEQLVAAIAPEETNPQNQRWCLDGQTFFVPASKPEDALEKKIRIFAPTYICNGWKMFIVV